MRDLQDLHQIYRPHSKKLTVGFVLLWFKMIYLLESLAVYLTRTVSVVAGHTLWS